MEGIIEIFFSQLTGSVSLFAQGLESLSDALVSFFVWAGLHFALRRPTKKFPYGYYKVESLAALVAAIILVGTSAYIFLRSYRALLGPKVIALPFLALLVLFLAGLVSLGLAIVMRRIASRQNLLSLRVGATNSIKDASSSFVAFASVFVSYLGFTQMDAIGGIFVGIYILTVAYVALRESSLILLDAFHEPELTRQIETIIKSHSQVRGVKELKLRRAGPFVVGILEVLVDGNMTVHQMHQVVTELEESVKRRIAGLRSLTVKAIPSA